jgi:alpha-L-rhamnosidase
MGEVYDASREEKVKGWSEPDYQDSEWKPAKAVPLEGTAYTESPGGEQDTPLAFPMRGAPLDFSRMQLIGQPDEPAGVFKVLKAQSVKEVRPGVFVYNLGQNITGVPRIMIRNGFPGRKITLRFSEMLYPDLPESGKNVGMIMTENYRAALSQDIYVLRAGEQVIQPRFTWHGFQYIEITGIDRALPIEDVEGVAVSSVRRLTADFRSSNEKVNRLWQNIVWSNADNFLWIPTDCPQRNERMGWSGDLNVFSRTATYISDAAGFLRRHMRAMRDTQEEGRFADIAPVGGGFGGILWGAAGIVVPWEAYWQYGDRALLEEHYPAMAAYMSHLKKSIHPETRLLGDIRLGDWLGFQNRMLGAEFLGEAYYVWCLDIMARVAELLGKTEDAKQYRQDYEDRKAFFNATFVSPEKRTLGIPSRGFGGGGGRAKPEFRLADTQSSYAVGLALNAFSEDNVPHMAKRLAETVERENRDDDGVLRPPYSLMTGFIGTAWISKALSQAGFTEHAYRLLQATHFPSWLYPVEQGATTIWERLNGYTIEQGFGGNNSMNSFNHYSFGAVGQWLMAHCLGVERAEPGFRRFILQPEPDPTRMMTWAGGHYESPYGTIRSSWRIEDGWLTYRATVPPNTTATLYLPAASVESVTEGGREARTAEGVTLLRYENGKAVYLLVSGDYEFRARQ